MPEVGDSKLRFIFHKSDKNSTSTEITHFSALIFEFENVSYVVLRHSSAENHFNCSLNLFLLFGVLVIHFLPICECVFFCLPVQHFFHPQYTSRTKWMQIYLSSMNSLNQVFIFNLLPLFSILIKKKKFFFSFHFGILLSCQHPQPSKPCKYLDITYMQSSYNHFSIYIHIYIQQLDGSRKKKFSHSFFTLSYKRKNKKKIK